MNTKTFWLATVERAVRAFASSLLSVLFVGGVVLDIRAVDWPNALGVAGGAALVSVLLSLVATSVGSSQSPSFVADPAAADKPPADPPARQPAHVRKLGDPTGERTWTTGGYPGGDGGGVLPPPSG